MSITLSYDYMICAEIHCKYIYLYILFMYLIFLYIYVCMRIHTITSLRSCFLYHIENVYGVNVYCLVKTNVSRSCTGGLLCNVILTVEYISCHTDSRTYLFEKHAISIVG